MHLSLLTLFPSVFFPYFVLGLVSPESSITTLTHDFPRQGLVNQFSFELHDAPTLMSMSTPYALFFGRSAEIERRSRNFWVGKMARKVLELIGTLESTPERWEIWLQRSEDLVTQCFELAEKTLEPVNRCSQLERLWVVGIIAAFYKYLPPDADGTTSQQKLDFYEWTAQIYVEIQAAKDFEPLMTQHFQSSWQGNSQLSVGQNDFQECLQRAQLLGEWDFGRLQGIPARIGRIQGLVPSGLLKSRLPESHSEIEEIVQHFRVEFKKANILETGDGLRHLFQYTMKHLQKMHDSVQKHLEDDSFFRDITRLDAQCDVIYLIEDLKEAKVLGADDGTQILDLLKGTHIQDTLHNTIDSLMTIVENGMSQESGETGAHLAYKLIIALGLIYPTAEKHLITNYIEKRANVPIFLAKLWHGYGKSMSISGDNAQRDYELLLLAQNPSYLQDARRQLSAINMQNSKSQAVQQMGHILSLLPRISGEYLAWDTNLHHAMPEIYKRVADTLKTASISDPVVLEMTFEFLFHLKEFKKEWGVFLLENMRQFKWFCDLIIESTLLVKRRSIDSWQQQPKNYHLQKSELQTFIQGILNFYINLLRYQNEGHIFPLERASDWLTQDSTEDYVTFFLFDSEYRINVKRFELSRLNVS